MFDKLIKSYFSPNIRRYFEYKEIDSFQKILNLPSIIIKIR